MKERGRPAAPSQAVQDNIEAVANLEHDFLNRRTTIDRFVDSVAAFTGSISFVLFHFIAFSAWALFGQHFDPYPYTLLSTVVSCEAVLLSALVLMKQNRMGAHADEREHLHLQINLLAEKEITKILQTQNKICEHLGIHEVLLDDEAREMSENTAVDHLAAELRDKIPSISSLEE